MLTPEEAFILDQKNNSDDLTGGLIMVLNGLADEVDEDTPERLKGLASRVAEARDRVRRDAIDFLGRDNYFKLNSLWISNGVSYQQTWKRGYVSDLDGNQIPFA